MQEASETRAFARELNRCHRLSVKILSLLRPISIGSGQTTNRSKKPIKARQGRILSRQIRPKNDSSGRFDKTSKGDLSQRWYQGARLPRTKATNDLLFFEETGASNSTSPQLPHRDHLSGDITVPGRDPGMVAAIHVFPRTAQQDVDGPRQAPAVTPEGMLYVITKMLWLIVILQSSRRTRLAEPSPARF
jgi:hypothetical protein